MVKFRLVPGLSSTDETTSAEEATAARLAAEPGRLSEAEQLQPWLTARRAGDARSRYYLRHEFQRRMEGFEAIRYTLQIQIASGVDESRWNPQTIWDEAEHPWIDLIRIQLTTTIPLTALCRTYFNIVDKPTCLRFVQPASVYDFRSYQYACAGMYTRFEIDHMQVSVR